MLKRRRRRVNNGSQDIPVRKTEIAWGGNRSSKQYVPRVFSPKSLWETNLSYGNNGGMSPFSQYGALSNNQRVRYNLRVTDNELIKFSKNIPVFRAMENICNSVANLEWTISPPEGADPEDPYVKSNIKRITMGFLRPNREMSGSTYRELIKAICKDALIRGRFFIEKQPAIYEDSPQLFWLWKIDPRYVYINSAWEGHLEIAEPVCWFTNNSDETSNWEELYRRDVVLADFCPPINEGEVPDSPLKIAFEEIRSWVRLRDYKSRVVENALRNTIISIKNTNEDEITRCRSYWREHIEGEGSTPILGGDISVVQLGAKNDEELYPQYTNFILTLIAVAFGVTRRDMGLTDVDNRATAGVAADSKFQDIVLPLAKLIIDNFNVEILEQFAPGYKIVLSDIEPRNEEKEADRVTKLFTSKIITRNEARQAVGFKPRPDSDVFYEGSSGAPPPEEDEDQAIGNNPGKNENNKGF